MKSYLNFRKQCVCYSEGTKPSEEIKCGAPQVAILDPLLFLIFVHDLQYVPTESVDPITFADDNNLFHSNSNIIKLFESVNQELANITTTKTKYMFFHKQTDRNNVPLKLSDLKFNNIILKRVTELKFLGVMIGRNLN